MLNNVDPLQTSAWKNLSEHFEIMKERHMHNMFIEDPGRFSRFSLKFEDILMDYSKNIINEETVALLLDLANEVNIKDAIEKMLQETVSIRLKKGRYFILHLETALIVRFTLAIKI